MINVFHVTEPRVTVQYVCPCVGVSVPKVTTDRRIPAGVCTRSNIQGKKWSGPGAPRVPWRNHVSQDRQRVKMNLCGALVSELPLK